MAYQRPLKPIKFTKEGLAALEKEYSQLQESRPAAVKELSRARELGDLSENGLYHAAKANLRSIDGRLRRLSYQIKVANVVSSPKIIVEENGQEIEYQIVGDYEADPKSNKVSANSPIGYALQNKKVGDIVKIQTPKGERILKILRIS